ARCRNSLSPAPIRLGANSVSVSGSTLAFRTAWHSMAATGSARPVRNSCDESLWGCVVFQSGNGEITQFPVEVVVCAHGILELEEAPDAAPGVVRHPGIRLGIMHQRLQRIGQPFGPSGRDRWNQVAASAPGAPTRCGQFV